MIIQIHKAVVARPMRPKTGEAEAGKDGEGGERQNWGEQVCHG